MKKSVSILVLVVLFTLLVTINNSYAGEGSNYYILTFVQSSFIRGDVLHPIIDIQKVDDEDLCKNTAMSFQQKHGSLCKCIKGSEKESDGKTSDQRYAPYYKKLPKETTYISYYDVTGHGALFIFAEDPSAVSSKMISIVVSNLEKGGAKDIKVIYPSN